MDLTHIPLEKLSISSVNMRHAKRAPDISDLLPSVRTRGILMPLLVRPTHVPSSDAPDTFEIVAGRRRYFAAKTVAEEKGEALALPCHVMTAGDDADALEASLIENLHRLDPDEMSQYETFVRLIKEGKTPDSIAASFGLTERQVRQRLALGNLLPKIREAYRAGDVDAESLRLLTMASKAQQKAWLEVYGDEREETPLGYYLKAWLFGEDRVATTAALFPLEQYRGAITADLFGEDSYFSDVDAFWTLQNQAIAAKRDEYLAAGWSDVVVLDVGQRFESWEYEKAKKKNGAKVFISVSKRGNVEVFEGYLTRSAARRAEKKAANDKTLPGEHKQAATAEVTAALQTYIDLYRHAGVRTALLDHPGVALRLMVAHAIRGSGTWSVKTADRRGGREDTDASLAAAPAEAAFKAKAKVSLSLLDLPEGVTLTAGHFEDTASVFARLLKLKDADVFRILALVMAETLDPGSAMVEAAGVHLGVDMHDYWQPDETFFDLIRDKTTLNAMVAEVAGKDVAKGNITAKGKAQKQIIKDCLAGTNGRAKVAKWLPGWMAFPVRAYKKNGGLATVKEWNAIKKLFPAKGK